jgi:hypothetical protein
VLIAGVTLALAFGTHQGQTFEQWIAHWVAHWLRPRRMAWRRGGDEIPPVGMEVPATSSPEPVPATAPTAAPVETGRDWVDLWFALVNAVMLAAMTSLTVYLADGGAEELRLWLLYKLR